MGNKGKEPKYNIEGCVAARDVGHIEVPQTWMAGGRVATRLVPVNAMRSETPPPDAGGAVTARDAGLEMRDVLVPAREAGLEPVGKRPPSGLAEGTALFPGAECRPTIFFANAFLLMAKSLTPPGVLMDAGSASASER